MDVEQQMPLFPDNVPPRVIRYWKAVKRWYSTGTTRPPIREELCGKFEPPIQPRTLDHIRQDRATRHLVGRWPPQPNDRPPWEIAAENNVVKSSDVPEPLQFNVVQDEIHHLYRVRMTAFDEEGDPVVITQYYDSLTNRLVDTIIERFHGTAVVVVGIFIFGVLDWLSDGRFDGVVCLLGLLGCPATA